MKKAFLFLAVGFVLIVAIAISGNANAASKKIAVIWDTKSDMVNRVVMGFLAKLRTLAPDMEVKQYRQLKDMNEQIYRLRFQLLMGQSDGLKKYRGLRKDRARVLTILRERELAAEAAKG